MKATFDRKALAEVLKVVSAAVPSRSHRPILLCLGIACSKSGKSGAARFHANNGEVSITMPCDSVAVEEPGDIAVPASLLNRVVTADNSETLRFVVEGDGLAVKGTSCVYRMQGHRAADLPPSPEFPNGSAKSKGSLKLCDLNGSLKATEHCMSDFGGTYALNGYSLSLSPKGFEVATADGNRLAATVAQLASEKEASCLIPPTVADVVRKLTDFEGKDAGECEVAVTDNLFFVRTGNGAVASSTLLEGKFPYPTFRKMVADIKRKVSVACEREKAVEALERVMVFAVPGITAAKVSFAGDVCGLEADFPGVGHSSASFPLTGHTGPDIEFQIDLAKLLPALKAAPGETVEMELADAKQNMVMRAGEYLCVLGLYNPPK